MSPNAWPLNFESLKLTPTISPPALYLVLSALFLCGKLSFWYVSLTHWPVFLVWDQGRMRWKLVTSPIKSNTTGTGRAWYRLTQDYGPGGMRSAGGVLSCAESSGDLNRQMMEWSVTYPQPLVAWKEKDYWLILITSHLRTIYHGPGTVLCTFYPLTQIMPP